MSFMIPEVDFVDTSAPVSLITPNLLDLLFPSALNVVWIATFGLAVPDLLSYSSVQEIGLENVVGWPDLPPLPRLVDEHDKD